MNKRAEKLIQSLKLQEHPEGGYYREIYRSPGIVTAESSKSQYSALTVIYFLLCAGQRSRWHRIKSDEVWQFCEGDPLDLHIIKNLKIYEVTRLSSLGNKSNPIKIVPAQSWQAAETLGEYTLVSCTVSPGFEFRDFIFLSEESKDKEIILKRFPKAKSLC